MQQIRRHILLLASWLPVALALSGRCAAAADPAATIFPVASVNSVAIGADGALHGVWQPPSVDSFATGRPPRTPMRRLVSAARSDSLAPGPAPGIENDPISGPILDLPILDLPILDLPMPDLPIVIGPLPVPFYPPVLTSPARIGNVSARALLGAGDAAQVLGLIVSGTSPEPAVMRIVNDGLAQFGLEDYSTNLGWSFHIGSLPVIPLPQFGYPSYSGSETLQDALLLAGAFPLGGGSDNAQVLISPGDGVPYTIQRSAPAAQAGITLFELYLPETPASAALSGRRLVNFSCRAQVGQGDQLFVVGLVVTGSQSLPVLIRGLGPALSSFGVADAVEQPLLTVYQGQTLVASNAGWQNQPEAAQVAAAAAKAGAFALAPGADSALLLNLAPGAYTAALQAAAGPGGVGMIELYDASD